MYSGMSVFILSHGTSKGSQPISLATAAKEVIVEPSGVQALKNPNPLKDVEALAVLGVAVLV